MGTAQPGESTQPQLIDVVTLGTRRRLPDWLRKPATHHASVMTLRARLRLHRLHTVCESARCPNLHECFHRGTATFMILGNWCTRSCGFCSVPRATQAMRPLLVDPEEPRNVAAVARELGLQHVVVTSVTRDDLPDGGAAHFAETIRSIREVLPGARVEVLVPDFRGDLAAVQVVLDAGPDVFAHNVETVPRLYPRVRPAARYNRSLAVLRFARDYAPSVLLKSSLMVGLGEQPEEVQEVLQDLRRVGVDVVTIGQYLQPTRRHLPVVAYVPLEQFEEYRNYGLKLGFRAVLSGPFVRSSYLAETIWESP